MVRRTASLIRLDIVGLDPRLFEICRQNTLSIIESRGKSRTISSDSNQTPLSPELSSLPKDQLALFRRLVSIAIDFERAYGRSVMVRVFQHSSNRFLNVFLRSGSRKSGGELLADSNPLFFVNGVKVFSGVPNSFSELDEAIDNAFGRSRKTEMQ